MLNLLTLTFVECQSVLMGSNSKIGNINTNVYNVFCISILLHTPK